jgi:molybdate transport system substrate-binding protein
MIRSRGAAVIRSRGAAVTRWVLAATLLALPARAADLTVLTAEAFKPVVLATVPAFEARTGVHVVVSNDTAGALVRRIKDGEHFDVIVLSQAGLTDLGGKAGPGVAVGRAFIGVGVKAGAPRPDIATAGAFKAAMLAARSVAYIDPGSGGSSGLYLAALFRRLGIAEAMAAKSVLIKGGLAAQAVVDGRAEIVVHQISEIMLVPGVDVAGPLPPDVQNETVYVAAIANGAPEAAASFVAALSAPEVAAVLTAKGLAAPGGNR